MERYGFFGGEGAGGEEVAAENTVEQAGVERGRQELLALTDKKGADGPFGQLSALVQKEHFIVTALTGEGEVAVEELPFGGFVVEQGVSGIGSVAGNAHAKRGGGRLHRYGLVANTEASRQGEAELYLESGGMSLGERHSAWLGTVLGSVLGSVAGKVDGANLAQLLFEIAEEQGSGGDVAGKAECCGRCCKPLKMLVKPEIAPVPEDTFEKPKLFAASADEILCRKVVLRAPYF